MFQMTLENVNKFSRYVLSKLVPNIRSVTYRYTHSIYRTNSGRAPQVPFNRIKFHSKNSRSISELSLGTVIGLITVQRAFCFNVNEKKDFFRSLFFKK